jgi:tetratricopeptide (TPR) repeat protein
LSAARAFVDAGDRPRALAEVNAALALDPDFLAAQSLRDRLLKKFYAAPDAVRAASNLTTAAVATPALAMAAPVITSPVQMLPATLPVPRPTPPVPPAPAVTVGLAIAVAPAPAVTGAAAVTIPADVPPPALPAAQPLVSAEGYARFEARAKRRRVDRRIEAARAALERRKLHEAASALDEIITLDPNLPELAGLTAEFDELRKAVASPHRGPWLTAAAVFTVVVLGASWRHDAPTLLV